MGEMVGEWIEVGWCVEEAGDAGNLLGATWGWPREDIGRGRGVSEGRHGEESRKFGCTRTSGELAQG